MGRIVSIQAPAAVVMVRPRRFHPNPQTAADNAFQREATSGAAAAIARAAFDEVSRAAYTARSNRADPVALERFCTHFNFEPMAFDSADAGGRPVYHTNAMMSVATEFALVGLDLVTDAARRACCPWRCRPSSSPAAR